MKKFDVKRMLIQLGAIVAVSVAVGLIVPGWLNSARPADKQLAVGPVFFMAVAFVSLFIGWVSFLAGGGFKGAAKKTFKREMETQNFKETSTFTTYNGFLAIDGVDGRVGYVSTHNPKEFQIAKREEITDVKSDYVKGPLGGTTMVYFSFKYNGKRTKIPTFVSNQAHSLKSDRVLEAISKADAYANLLRRVG